MSDTSDSVAAVDGLEDFFEYAPIGLHIVAADGTILRANKAELDLLGYAREDYVGRQIGEFHADPPVLDHILGRLADGEKLDRCPARLRAKDGTIKHVLISSNAQFRHGLFVSTRCFTIDVTDAIRAESRSLEWSRQLLEALPAAVYTTDAAGRVTYYNRAAIELAGRQPLIGHDEWCVTAQLYKPDGTKLPHDECPMAVALKEKREIRGEEAVLERPDGTRVPFLAYPTPLRDAETGEIIGAINMLVDISERKRGAATQALLVKELNHRINNSLANVQALARLTLRRSKSPAQFMNGFNGRVRALARGHALLSDATWSGADLETLIDDQLSSAIDEWRLSTSGPPVTLEPEMALQIAMVLHELTTNAEKHGALSVAHGRVDVRWGLNDKVLRLDWSERGGPQPAAPITRGFGTMLIERSVVAHGGEARMICTADGISWDITLLLPRHSNETGRSTATEGRANANAGKRAVSQTTSAHRPMAGKHLLLVEGEPLVALDVAASLEGAGILTLGPAATLDEALRLIRSAASLDGALVDAKLSGPPVDELVAELNRRTIPFAFFTGGGREVLPAALRDATVIEKACAPEDLLEALRQVLMPGNSAAVPRGT
jgi:PAS domain S-box-containing protein